MILLPHRTLASFVCNFAIYSTIIFPTEYTLQFFRKINSSRGLQAWLFMLLPGKKKKVEWKTSLVLPAARDAAETSPSCWRTICSRGGVRGRRNDQEWLSEGAGDTKGSRMSPCGAFSKGGVSSRHPVTEAESLTLGLIPAKGVLTLQL